MHLSGSLLCLGLAPVVKVIGRLNRYPVASDNKTNHAIYWIVIYAVDSIGP